MTTRKRLKEWVAKTARAMQLMAAGAYLLAFYLTLDPIFREPLRLVLPGLLLATAGFGMIAEGLAAKPGAELKQPSPRWSGVYAIGITGGLAAIGLATGTFGLGQNVVVAALVAGATVIACIAIWRFATKHAGEIGEARFVTTPPGT